MQFPQSFVELEKPDTGAVSYVYHLYHKKKQVDVKFFKLILLRVNFLCVSVLFNCFSPTLFSFLFFFEWLSFLCQFRFIVFSNAIFMKDGFIFHKRLCKFVLIFKLETSEIYFGNILQVFCDRVERIFCWIKA